MYPNLMKWFCSGVCEGKGQTLPIIPRSTPEDEISASLKHSALWRHVKTLKLTTNMRVRLQKDRSAEIFPHQLLDIGNRKPELCNGTRLAVQKLTSNITEATILTGPYNDEDALIPHIPMIPTGMPF
ncbi:ATP-dependent DNA helicase [Trichonephila clavipes]|nr:ATP-dependent DNA helicase [Trichonephila clavipes]